MEPKENWTRIAGDADDLEFGENGIASLDIAGKTICVFRTPDGLKACSSKCPHAGGDLSGGWLDAKGHITCPVHGYRFSVNHGRDCSAEGYFLKIYLVKQSGEGVFVKLA